MEAKGSDFCVYFGDLMVIIRLSIRLVVQLSHCSRRFKMVEWGRKLTLSFKI